MKIFQELSQLERAVALGALQPGDCVHVATSQLRALGDEERARLAHTLAEVGARLVEDDPHETAVVYGPGEQRPPDC